MNTSTLYNNIVKVSAAMSDEVLRETNMLLLSARNNPHNQYAIVAMFGSWDLTGNPPRLVVNTYLKNFTSGLNVSYAQQRHLYSNVKLLVIGPPSLPDDMPDGLHKVKRNNWVSAAFTHKLKQHMASINVEFLDQFSFTFPLYQENDVALNGLQSCSVQSWMSTKKLKLVLDKTKLFLIRNE